VIEEFLDGPVSPEAILADMQDGRVDVRWERVKYQRFLVQGGAEDTTWNGFDGRLPGDGWRGCRGACRRAHIRVVCAGRGGSVLGEPAPRANP
jgi:hypothetical protein